MITQLNKIKMEIKALKKQLDQKENIDDVLTKSKQLLNELSTLSKIKDDDLFDYLIDSEDRELFEEDLDTNQYFEPDYLYEIIHEDLKQNGLESKYAYLAKPVLEKVCDKDTEMIGVNAYLNDVEVVRKSELAKTFVKESSRYHNCKLGELEDCLVDIEVEAEIMLKEQQVENPKGMRM
ncbi:Mbov_0392 family ICE element protein [Ureaplasma diversum]|uniref:Uncharacterized protein n=1 Tax=Ureaplasma diversum NCTC 246 TaxID=1188241 RepID=A0A084EZ25_9BACT|nr:hypothetical protein [Ureaplasma diversum]KEZ23217.1 hypothetical protein UDIV_3810 [Ureaplasma diversum NCTC 246]